MNIYLLPQEIIFNVIERLYISDALNFCLTCKYLFKNISDDFWKCFLDNKTTKRKFRNLKDNCKWKYIMKPIAKKYKRLDEKYQIFKMNRKFEWEYFSWHTFCYNTFQYIDKDYKKIYKIFKIKGIDKLIQLVSNQIKSKIELSTINDVLNQCHEALILKYIYKRDYKELKIIQLFSQYKFHRAIQKLLLNRKICICPRIKEDELKFIYSLSNVKIS